MVDVFMNDKKKIIWTRFSGEMAKPDLLKVEQSFSLVAPTLKSYDLLISQEKDSFITYKNWQNEASELIKKYPLFKTISITGLVGIQKLIFRLFSILLPFMKTEYFEDKILMEEKFNCKLTIDNSEFVIIKNKI
jgi:hypothetical protein